MLVAECWREILPDDRHPIIYPLLSDRGPNMDVTPYGEKEIFSAFHESKSFSKHLLTIYSLAVGVNAKKIVDVGIGSTTRSMRFAAQTTGGVCYSCDVDAARFSGLLDQQDEHWKLFLGPSEKFFAQLDGPLDFVMHDAAHDYYQVKMDLEAIIPKMKRFGLICLHDTQQTELSHNMLAAIKDVLRGKAVSMVNLPFSSGLAIIRIEESSLPEIVPSSGLLPDGKIETTPVACAMQVVEGADYGKADTSLGRWLRWRARKVIKGS